MPVSKWITIGIPIGVVVLILAIVLPLTLKKSSPSAATTKYICNTSNGTCSVDPKGTFTSQTECQANCKAPVTTYSCNTTTGQCNPDASSSLTKAQCQANCKTPVTTYSCNTTTGQCNPDASSSLTKAQCQANCTSSVTTYSCNTTTGQCNPDASSTLTKAQCQANCSQVASAFGCDTTTGACVPQTGGSFSTSNCNSSCVMPVAPRNNPTIQVAMMDLNAVQSDLDTMLPFFQKYVPNKILWKTTGPLCSTVTASNQQHISYMVQVCYFYKQQGLTYPNIALCPDCSTTSCYTQGVECQDALQFYPVMAKYAINWQQDVESYAPKELWPYLCKELVLEQEGVTNGGDPNAFAACRKLLPANIALSCLVEFTQLTSGSGPLIKNSIIGDNSFRPGTVYLEMYNMYTEKAPFLYDVVPTDKPDIQAICAANTCSPPLGQSIYGGPSVLSPVDAATRVLNIMNSGGKFVGFSGTCSQPCSLRNFVFLFSFEQATSGTGPLYLLGNTVNPWSFPMFQQYIQTFTNGVLTNMSSGVTINDIQIGVYNIRNAITSWDKGVC